MVIEEWPDVLRPVAEMTANVSLVDTLTTP